MIIDHALEFAWNKTLSGGTTTSDPLDFGQAHPSTGRNTDDLYIVTTVKEDVGGALQVEVQQSKDKSGSYETIAMSEKLTAPKAGNQLVIKMPESHLQFLKLKFTGGNSGKVSAVITRGYSTTDAFKQAKSITDTYKQYSQG